MLVWKQIGIILTVLSTSIIALPPIPEKESYHAFCDALLQRIFGIKINTADVLFETSKYRDDRARELFTKMFQDGKCVNASTAYTTFDCSLFRDFQSIMIAEMGHTNPINVSMVDWYYFDYMRNKTTPLDYHAHSKATAH
jgi:hypothetical protein